MHSGWIGIQEYTGRDAAGEDLVRRAVVSCEIKKGEEVSSIVWCEGAAESRRLDKVERGGERVGDVPDGLLHKGGKVHG